MTQQSNYDAVAGLINLMSPITDCITLLCYFSPMNALINSTEINLFVIKISLKFLFILLILERKKIKSNFDLKKNAN